MKLSMPQTPGGGAGCVVLLFLALVPVLILGVVLIA